MGSMGLKRKLASLLALLSLSASLTAYAGPKTYQPITTTDRGGSGADLSGSVIGGILYLSSDSPRKFASLNPTGNGLKIIRYNAGATAPEAIDFSFANISGSLSSGQDYSVGTPGTYTKVTTNAAGRISSGTQAAFSDLSGSVAAAQLPNPSASTLGGIQSYAAVSNQWINSISTSGVPSSSQPAFSNLSGNIAVSQMNSGTGASGSTFFRGDNTWAAPASGGGFGGDGSDGAVTKGAVTESNVKQYNCTTFTQTVSTTYVPYGGTHINATGAVAFNGTTNVTANIPGGNVPNDGYYSGGTGSGPSPGSHADAMTSDGNINGGASGGGCGGKGGQGWGYTPSWPATQAAGRIGGAGMPLTPGLTGSGGGGGKTNTSAAVGGNGGGRFTVHAVGAITIGSGGSVNADGGTGGSDGTAPGAGGSGGVIGFFSQTSITRTGNISLKGGDEGGSGSTGTTGGGGGGGWYIGMSPSNTGAGSITLTGGVGGSTSTGEVADGSTGQSLEITGTPNLPTLVWLFDNVGTKQYVAFVKDHHGHVTHWELAKAACGDETRKCLAFCRPDRELSDSPAILRITQDNIVKFRRRDLTGDVA